MHTLTHTDTQLETGVMTIGKICKADSPKNRQMQIDKHDTKRRRIYCALKTITTFTAYKWC